MQHVFMRWPAQVLFGRGVLAEFPAHLPRLGVRRALIVTDPGIRRAGLLERVAGAMRASGAHCELFDKVHPDPPLEDVLAGAEIARQCGVDAIVGLGGGSAMDAAKAIAVLTPEGRCIEELFGHDRVPTPGLTKILIPTTGGSGSEISDSCNFSDHRAGDVKRILLGRHLLADLSVVDPALTDHAPPSVTAESGIDALTHGLEAFLCRNASTFSDIWAREAMRLAARSLPEAVERGAAAPQARDDMALAAMLGNAAADMAGLGAVHGLTHGLTARYPISHGRSNAILLPVVTRFNAAAQPARYAEIAGIFSAFAPRPGSDAADALQNFCAAIGLAGRLRDFGIGAAELPQRALSAVGDFPRHFGANPRPVSPEDAAGLYSAAW